jgi:cytochrome c2
MTYFCRRIEDIVPLSKTNQKANMQHFNFIKQSRLVGFLFALLFVSNTSFAQDGKQLFTELCASCHRVDKPSTGPALMGVEDRWPNKENLYAWIRNNAAFRATGDKYANDLYITWNKTSMNAFPSLKDAEIEAILKYIREYKVDVPPPPPPGDDPEKGGNSLLYGLLSIILAVVAFILLQVNSNLKKLTDDKTGELVPEPVPFWRNTVYIATAAVGFFVLGGYLMAQGAIKMGRSKDYQPKQPIYYSHKVHAGINQINCQYCHSSVTESKHATIPSVNVCMNCHMAINEYNGEKMYDEDGNEINGTGEINKLYAYAGFDPKANKPWDPAKATPIPWARIHNLPDHVYFNHAQHVKAGQVACQSCHGEIQKMGEVYQFSDLSMGWCINCHRETKVQFKDNGFYSLYEKYHEDLKGKKIDSVKGVTVEMIGGTECQKCHY